MSLLCHAFVFIFGLLIGSFLNVVILRAPHGRSLGGRSACPHCQYQLRPVDLVPVFSFIYLRGRCRNCKTPISWRYPFIELCVAILFTWSFIHIAPVGMAGYVSVVYAWIVISVCVVTFAVDFEHYLILDRVTFTGVLLIVGLHCVAVLAASPGPGFSSTLLVSSLWGLAAGFVPFFLLWFFSRGRLMGFGDVKFMVFAGLALGWPVVMVALLLAFWLGALVALPLLLAGKKRLHSRIPFGTFLAAAVVVALLYGSVLWEWYVSLLRVH